MNRTLAILFISFVIFPVSWSQNRFRIVEYNVENLFDTIHTEGFQDEEFTPSGNHKWAAKLYWKKLGTLARTIADIGSLQPADIIMLCEVENDSVMYDLTKRTLLRRIGYEYIISHSLDERGINVALLYQPTSFMPLSTDSIRIFPPQGVRRTRDILHVTGICVSGDTLDLLMVHMPSRSGGRRQTEKWRCRVADSVGVYCDRIYSLRTNPNIIILGDFNDEADSKSIRKKIKAVPKTKISSEEKELIILPSTSSNTEIEGTYFFRNRWYELDHFIVSSNLFRKSQGLRLKEKVTHIFSKPFLLEKGITPKPKRTFKGNFYNGGLSDHLPIYIDLVY